MTITLKVEGITLSQNIRDIELKATFTPAGGSAVIDKARFSVAGGGQIRGRSSIHSMAR